MRKRDLNKGRVLLVALFGLCVSGLCVSGLGLSAPAHAMEITDQQREACTPDAFRLCSAEIPDIPRVTACMETNRARLSAACKAVFNAVGEPHVAARENEHKVHHARRHVHHWEALRHRVRHREALRHYEHTAHRERWQQ